MHESANQNELQKGKLKNKTKETYFELTHKGRIVQMIDRAKSGSLSLHNGLSWSDFVRFIKNDKNNNKVCFSEYTLF